MGRTAYGQYQAVWAVGQRRYGIADGVTSIGLGAFSDTFLKQIYFQGNAPDPSRAVSDSDATIYYLPGTTGWDTSFEDHPTAVWVLPSPLILNHSSGFGVQTNGFGFIISWATNNSVVVEASSDPANPSWSPVATNTLAGGSTYFSDPQWANYPRRFYRLRSQ